MARVCPCLIVAVDLNAVRTLSLDMSVAATGAEPLPVELLSPLYEMRLQGEELEYLRSHYAGVYADQLEYHNFDQIDSTVFVSGAIQFGMEKFTSSRGRSDRSSYILLSDSDGHLVPAKVLIVSCSSTDCTGNRNCCGRTFPWFRRKHDFFASVEITCTAFFLFVTHLLARLNKGFFQEKNSRLKEDSSFNY